jgi:D-3-phosphoglycerate dehydrogenase
VSETRRPQQGIYDGYIKIAVTLSDGTSRRVAGTVFSDGRPRLIQIRDINLDAEFAPHFLFVINEDKPALSASSERCSATRGQHWQTSRLAAARRAATQFALVEVDGGVSESVLEAIRKLPLVRYAKALAF